MKIVIIGAGSVAFTPALISGFGADRRYAGATIGLVDVSEASLDLIDRLARRVSDAFELDWTVEASIERRDILKGADVVTTAIGVGGMDAWEADLEVPRRYGILQPVGDTSGPGGLGRALRHIPALVEIARDMESLCPAAALYNFTNPLTVTTQALRRETSIDCTGLCIGVDLTWRHLCGVLGVEKKSTSINAAGINHCHWITDFVVNGEDGFPLLRSALAEKGRGEPLCESLFLRFGAYPGPGDGHVAEFVPHLMRPFVTDPEAFHGGALRGVRRSYPEVWSRMEGIALRNDPIEAESFARELAWEHTQLLELLVSRMDDRGDTFYVNLPNRGAIRNIPAGAVVEAPARADRLGLRPYAIGDLPDPVVPILAGHAAAYDLVIDAALEGNREKAVQAFLNDPHCPGIEEGARLVNELIDTEREWLPRFFA